MAWIPGVLQKKVAADGRLVPSGLFAGSQPQLELATIYLYLFPWFFDYRDGHLALRGIDTTAIYRIDGIRRGEDGMPELLCRLVRNEWADPVDLEGVPLYGWLCTNAEDAHRHPATAVPGLRA